MRTGQNFWLLYVMLAIVEILVCNYLQISLYAVISLLPAMILSIPLQIGTSVCMIIAFATGLTIDWLSEGFIGLNAASILPVALLRKQIIRIFLGEDLITRKDSFTFRKNGTMKIAIATTTAVMVYLAVYIFLDGAGTRPMWFNFTRFGISTVINSLIALFITGILTPDDRR